MSSPNLAQLGQRDSENRPGIATFPVSDDLVTSPKRVAHGAPTRVFLQFASLLL